MNSKVYTILDLAEELGKDKQFIRRKIMSLNLKSINKSSRKHSNEPLKYDYNSYVELAKELGVSNSNTHDMQSDVHSSTQKHTETLGKDKLIEILERELKHSKDKLKNAEEEKQNLMKLLDQQQRLSLNANQKIEKLEYKEKENKEEKKKGKWYDFLIRNK